MQTINEIYVKDKVNSFLKQFNKERLVVTTTYDGLDENSQIYSTTKLILNQPLYYSEYTRTTNEKLFNVTLGKHYLLDGSKEPLEETYTKLLVGYSETFIFIYLKDIKETEWTIKEMHDIIDEWYKNRNEFYKKRIEK